jgi:SAM-dependent methyltransferase
MSAALPEWAKKPLRPLRDLLRRLAYYGKRRFCPVCGSSSSRFERGGTPPREDALCVHCGALERHRLLWLFLSAKTALFERGSLRMLHVAPERSLEPKFRAQLGDQYLTADLLDPRAMVRMDITAIQYADQTFDAIYCSHVLEHVPDDRRAMREFFRVLKNDGWAILLVPITASATFEDPSITDPQERLRLFGQEDHVRAYGPDYVERLREAGFTVAITKVADLASAAEAARMGLTSASGEIYYCTK